MFWTVVIVSVGLAVVFKVFMLRKFAQWMTADRLARLADGDPARLAQLRALHDRLKADGLKGEVRWAKVEAAAQTPGR